MHYPGTDKPVGKLSISHKDSASIKIILIFVLLMILLTALSATSHAKGSDPIPPFPIADAQAGKQEAKAMTVDTGGNIIVAGYTNNGVSNDYQVTKFKADGSGLAWPAVNYGGGGNDVVTAVATDSDNNIIVAGYTWNGSNYDIHTIKYSGTDGTVLWEHSYDAASANDWPTSIAVDGSGNIYVAGYSANGIRNDDFLVLKYPSAGTTPEWVELYDDTAYPNNDNRIMAISAGTGGIAVTGYSSKGGADFDILTRKYGFDKALIREWRYSSAGTKDDRGVAVKMDTAGFVIITGYLTNASNNTDIYTAKYDPSSATPVWQKIYDGNGNDEPKGLWVDNTGEVYVTASTATLAGGLDFYTARYNSGSGTVQWQAILDAGNGSTDIPVGIVTDNSADGGVFVEGITGVSGNNDFLTLKYRKDNGTLLWEKTWNGSGNKNDQPAGIVLEPAGGTSPGSVCVAGWTDGVSGYDFTAIKYDFGALNAPSILSAIAASNTSITLTWADNSSNEDTFIIQRKLGENGTFADIATIPATLPANTTTYTDNGLSTNNYYYYRVRANNGVNGDSYHSNEARALTKIISYDAPAWDYLYDGNSKEDIATGIAVGFDDNPVVTGSSLLPDSGGDSFDYVTIKLNRATKAEIWKTPFDSGDGGNDEPAGIAVDNNNDVLVTGTAYLYGGGDENSDDLYTTKYLSASGSQVTGQAWPRQYGTPNWADFATAVITAPNGSSAVIGYGLNAPQGSGNDDIYVIKYNADGSSAWAAPYIYNSGRNDYPVSVAFDASGNILIAGYTQNSSGNDDWFVAKINGSSGALVWSDQVDGSGHGDDQAFSIATDSTGDVYVTGYMDNGASNEDIQTIKYKGSPPLPPAAEQIWAKQYNGPASGNDRGIAIRIDPIDGAVVVAGNRYTTSTDSDLYLIRYNAADGAVIWQENFDRSATYDYATAMTMDSSGYIYLAGNSRGGQDTDADFDASSNILSVIYDYEGTFLGAMTYNGTANRQDEANAITVNYQGESFIAGLSRNAGDIANYVVLKQKNNYILVPAPLTATAQADFSKVNLGWRENTPGTSFRIERTQGPSSPLSVWTLVATKSSGTITHTDTGLASGSTYCYRIDASIGTLNSRKIEKCVTTTLPAPSLSALSVDSSTQITLNWNQVDNNTGYKIERKIGAGAWADLTTKTAGLNSHVDSGLTAGTVYYYRVSTNSAAGCSLASNERNATTRPAAPAQNATTGITSSQATINWSNVDGETGYKIERKEGSGGTWGEIATRGQDVLSYTDTGLTYNTQYYYRVRATNASGDSGYSGEQGALTLFTSTTLTSAAGSSATQVDLTWNNVAGETGYTIQEASCSYNNNGDYDVSYCIDAYTWAWSGWTSIDTVGADLLSYQRTGRSSGYSYKYRVIANTTGNSSAPSNEIIAWTWMTAPSLSLTPASETSLTATWTNILAATNYTLERKPGSGGSWAEVTGAIAMSASTVTYTNTGLALSTEYCYRVKAYSTLPNNPPSVYSNEPCLYTPLAAPTLAAPTATASQVDLSWNNVAGNTGYELQMRTMSTSYAQNPASYWNQEYAWGAWGTIATLAADTVSYTKTGLTAGYTYQFRARDTYPGGYSAWSNSQWITTIPPAPTLNVPTAASTSQLNNSWGDVYGETGFKLEWKQRSGGDCTDGAWNGPISIGQNTTTYNHTGLSLGTYYCYRIYAANGSGNSGYSTERSQTTLLGAPTLNALSGVAASNISLSWGNISGNTGYKIERKTGAGGTWSQINLPAQDVTSYTNSGLTAGTLYYYRVSTANAGGYSAVSNEQSATTTPAKPSTALTALSSSQVLISWPVIQGATNYKVEQKLGAGGSWSEISNVAAAYGESYCGYSVPRIGCTTLTANTASTIGNSLAANTTYCYQVKSWNSTGGDSVASDEKCASTSAMSNQSLNATPVNSFMVRLDWSPIACSPDPCDNPDGYELEKQVWNGGWILIKTLPGAVTSYTDSVGINPDKSYKYRVRTFKAADRSAYSNEAVTTTPGYTTGHGTCQ